MITEHLPIAEHGVRVDASVPTLGRAVDVAIAEHERRHPQSVAYLVRHASWDAARRAFVVQLDASHFSVAPIYLVGDVGASP